MSFEFAEVCREMDLREDEKRIASLLQCSDYTKLFKDLVCLGANEETAESFKKISCCLSLFRMKQMKVKERSASLHDDLKFFLEKKVE